MADGKPKSISLQNGVFILVDAPQMEHVPRILSLDGGGVRGLSTLLILRDIMEEIGRKMGTNIPAKPCDYFDLIGGTSTGGLIAIMLGLLGMVSFDPSRINE